MTRKPRTTMNELKRALSMARLPHLELVKLVGSGYFLKDTQEDEPSTVLMPAREMHIYLTALAEGATIGRREILSRIGGIAVVNEPIAEAFGLKDNPAVVVADCDRKGGE